MRMRTGAAAHPVRLCARTSHRTGGLRFSALSALGSVRSIHTPPGGFDQDLPPSFGSGGKGETSNINSLAMTKKMLRLKKNRRKLIQPFELGKTDAEQVKAELQALITKNAAYTGRRYPPEEKIHLVGENVGDEAFFNDRERGHFDHEDAQKVARRRHGGAEAEWDATVRRSATMLDQAVVGGTNEADAFRSQREETLSTETVPTVDTKDKGREAAMRSSAIFPLDVADRAGLDALNRLPTADDGWRREQSLEKRFAVTPGSTVLGSDLDRLERDMLREYDQRGASLPAIDPVYSKFGAGRYGRRMTWQPSSSFDKLRPAEFDRNRSNEKVRGDNQNRNLSSYHMSAEAYRERYAYLAHGSQRQRQQTAASLVKHDANLAKRGASLLYEGGGDENGVGDDSVPDAERGDLPAAANPHFPASSDADTECSGGSRSEGTSPGSVSPMEHRVVVVNARTDYHADLVTVRGERDDFPYDAYNQRPSEEGLVNLRGVEYWNDHKHRADIEERAQYRRDRFELEKLTEGAVDTSEIEHSTNRVRRETFLYFQSYPINEMIQESFVRIREIMPKGGGNKVVLNRVEPHDPGAARSLEEREALDKLNADVDIPLQEARRLAQSLGLDLIRIGSLNTQKSDRRVIALCQIGDHREHLRDMIKFKIQKLGVQPPPTRECIEVPFRGGTHPHAIRFKAVGIAKHLLHRHAIRINLTKLGTPREGFPVFQSILDEVKRQCMQLKAYHKAGEIQANYDEIYCYLYPSTGRSPKTTVDHPTPQQVREARDFRVLENEKEIYFDDLHNQITQKERLRYLTKLDNGTAWAEKDEGMSLQRQRAIKVMLGYLPKGNNELYAARGDVNIPAPFRASHMTTTERWGNPAESNLEQASRGAATLGKRAAMPISEMHDRGETPENPTQLDRFYYRVQGPALEVGEFKEALGLKDNRKKRPPLGSGFGTLGVGGASGFEQGSATK